MSVEHGPGQPEGAEVGALHHVPVGAAEDAAGGGRPGGGRGDPLRGAGPLPLRLPPVQAGRPRGPSPAPALLEVSRVVPLYSLVQDNVTKEAFKSATMSSYWCAGKGDVIDNWCRCDLTAFGKDGLPNCSPLRQPVLRLAPHLEPSSTMVALEWVDVEPIIGYKVSDYIIQHKRVEDQSEAEIYTGEAPPPRGGGGGGGGGGRVVLALWV
ncbi:hypothetical protein ANANG_G00270100 [Anguilla anguilla]|uniref:Astrotactin-1/2 Fn3 domain-containing protein n=1 Tax=Anguilla anguilla TaxID=7936 RepID=A0A9D3RLP8_ANGAN|nr:hypothetical protein ANANG_G00270100 [Anguilla anguilla]